jgi:hypothetical protein
MADASGLRRVERAGARQYPFPLERRRDKRVGFVTPTLIDDQRHWEDARSANVSAHGMLLRTSRPFSKGSVVDVYFELPNGRSVQTSGVVVSARPGSASLHFSAITTRNRAVLRRFVVERRALRALRGRTLRSRPLPK